MSRINDRLKTNDQIIKYFKKLSSKQASNLCIKKQKNKYVIEIGNKNFLSGKYLGQLSANSDIFEFEIGGGKDKLIGKTVPINVASFNDLTWFSEEYMNREIKFMKLFSNIVKKKKLPNFLMYYGMSICKDETDFLNEKINKSIQLTNNIFELNEYFNNVLMILNDSDINDPESKLYLRFLDQTFTNLGNHLFEEYKYDFLDIDYTSTVYIEKADGSFHKYIAENLLFREYYNSLIFQIFTAIYTMHKSKVIHMDLHISNVLLINETLNNLIEYTIDNNKYYAKTINKTPIISDFGQSIFINESTQKLSDKHKGFIYTRLNHFGVDPHMILYHLNNNTKYFKDYLLLYDYIAFLSTFLEIADELLNELSSRKKSDIDILLDDLSLYFRKLKGILTKLIKEMNKINNKKLNKPQINDKTIIKMIYEPLDENINKTNVKYSYRI